MNRFNRSLLATVIAGGLCGGVAIVHAGLSNNTSSVQRLDDEHWKHPPMHHALDHLRQARHELEDAEDVFKGHREEALDHVDNAIKQIEAGLKEQHDEAALPAQLPSAGKLDNERFPHMHHALAQLREARSDLDSADKIFGGHRDEAIEQTDKAINQLEEGIHDAEK